MIQPSTIRFFGSLMFYLMFSSIHGQTFVTNGSATALGGDCYQITPDVPSQSGNIFSQNTIDLTQPFFEEATFFFGCKDANGADGIVFILATTNTSTGNGGGGIGYEGITPSIAIEYDDYFNSNYGDPTSDHMAIVSMGSVDHNLSTNLAGPINLSNIEDCGDHCFVVSWDPVTQTLAASLDEEVISYTGDIVNTIFSGTTQVYYGFSSGTGSLSNLHTVCFGPPALDPMPDESVCEGESAVLEADQNGIAWTWEPDPTLSQYNISDPEATPDITTTYRVEIEYACGYFRNDTVVVSVLPLPDVDATNDGPVCVGETIHLMADGGTSYEWDGPNGFISTSQNPTITNVNIDDAGVYYVTVTDAEGCSSTASTEVVIDEGPDITIDPPPDPLCDNLDPIEFTASPPGGMWDGEITPDGLFDPDYAESGIHIITYTVDNALGCFNTEEISVEVLAAPDVVINPPGPLCVTGDPVQLTGTPTGGIWEGEITIGGVFDPVDAGLGTHIITYTAEDPDGCTNSEQISIEVVTEQMATITPQGPFCGMDTITLFADPPGGTWGGIVNSIGQILPYELPAGFYTVTYQLNGINQCYNTEITIEIQYLHALDCPNVPPVCFNSPAFTITAVPAGGVWSGAADSSGVVDPITLGPGLHYAYYTYPGNVCIQGVDCWSLIQVLDAPVISNLNTICDSLSAFYTVSFSILGGGTLSYHVSGTTTGTILPGLPYTFVSDPLPSGSPYTFVVDDINHCYPDTITGTNLCNCATDAGDMNLTSLTACANEAINVLPPTGVVLEPDDSLVYVVHLGFPDSILLVSDSLSFHLVSPLLPGVTYFVSSVAGNASSGIGVDLSDPCLSVSFGTPVMWVEEPAGFITGTSAVCEGEGAALTFTLSGTGPFDVTYSDGTSMYLLEDISSGHSVMVLPLATTIYTLIEVSETTTPICIGHPGTTHTVVVLQNFLTPLSAQICYGDSLFVGGAYETSAGTYTDSLQTINGCDSILLTSLTVFSLDTIYLSDTSCDTMQTGVFTDVFTDYNGCDSTTITTVTWVLADTTLLQSNTCDLQAAGVFTDIYTGQSGCDSVVIETITYVPPDSTYVNDETCDPSLAGMFIEVLMNESGCDSFIIETIMLIPSDTTVLNGQTCDPDSAGIFTKMLTNYGGCDSLVIETINLLPSDTTIQYQATCIPQDTGTVEQLLVNTYGCDSLLWTIIFLAPTDSCLVPVVHREVFTPNVFSPNGDGINDFFFLSSHPEAVAKIPILRIYDRWGGLVFQGIDLEPNRPEQGWNGKIDGEFTNPGVFVWVTEVEYTDGLMETISGDVTIIR